MAFAKDLDAIIDCVLSDNMHDIFYIRTYYAIELKAWVCEIEHENGYIHKLTAWTQDQLADLIMSYAFVK